MTREEIANLRPHTGPARQPESFTVPQEMMTGAPMLPPDSLEPLFDDAGGANPVELFQPVAPAWNPNVAGSHPWGDEPAGTDEPEFQPIEPAPVEAPVPPPPAPALAEDPRIAALEEQLRVLTLQNKLAQLANEGPPQIDQAQLAMLASRIPVPAGEDPEDPKWVAMRQALVGMNIALQHEARMAAQVEARKYALGLTPEKEADILRRAPQINSMPEPQRSRALCEAYEILFPPRATPPPPAAAPQPTAPVLPQRPAPQPMQQRMAPMPAHQPQPQVQPQQGRSRGDELLEQWSKLDEIRDRGQRSARRKALLNEILKLQGYRGGLNDMARSSFEFFTGGNQ